MIRGLIPCFLDPEGSVGHDVIAKIRLLNGDETLEMSGLRTDGLRMSDWINRTESRTDCLRRLDSFLEIQRPFFP